MERSAETPSGHDLARGRPSVRPMRAADVDAVVAIERGTFTMPWSAGTFRDLLARGRLLGFPSELASAAAIEGDRSPERG